MSESRQKVVLITGCSSGFGKLTAQFMSKHIYRIYAGMHHENELKLLENRTNIIPIHLDVTWPQPKINSVIEKIIEKENNIDVLINNAGFALLGPIADLTDAELKDQFETNFFGHIRLTKVVLKYMRRQKSGLVIMINSISGLVTTSFYGAYSASKFALEAATSALRFEEAAFGINIVSINPGSHTTNFWENIKWAKASPEVNAVIQKVVEKISWHRHNPVNVIRQIHKVIEYPYPRKNYIVGLNAKFEKLIFNIVPYPVLDFLSKKFTKKIIR